MNRSISITPETFTLVPYDAQEIIGLLAGVADDLDVPDVPMALVIDEELFAPLVGTASDVVDGAVQLWISGANLEDKTRPRNFDADSTRNDFAHMLLRASDRLRGEFADAPSDPEMRRAERASWDVWAVGRADRRGYPARPQARRYEFRLQHGFSDVADAVFDELWEADDDAYGWSDLVALSERSGANLRDTGTVPVGVLQQTSRG